MNSNDNLIENIKNITINNEKSGQISLLNWNVCVKMKNTRELIDAFDKMSEIHALPQIFVTQEAVKRYDKNADADWDTYEFIEKYYNNNIYSPTFSTRVFDEKGGGVFSVGGEVGQGQLTSTNLKILDTCNEFFVGKFEKLYEDFSKQGIMNQPRLYQATILELPNGGCVQIVNLHGCWNADKTGGKDSTMMVKKLINDFKDATIPTIILGDFNLIPTSSEIAKMNEYFNNLNINLNVKATRPIFQDGLDNITENDPQSTVDYIFVNNLVKTNNCKIFVDNTNLVSDHYPMILSFDCEKVMFNSKIHGYKNSMLISHDAQPEK